MYSDNHAMVVLYGVEFIKDSICIPDLDRYKKLKI